MSQVLPHQTIADLAEMLASRAAEVAEKLLPKGKRVNNEWVCGSVHGEEGTSLSVRINGDKAGVWKDFAADVGGDLVELWTMSRGIEKGEALKEIRQFLNLKPGVAPAAAKRSAPKPPSREAEPAKPISTQYHQELRSNLAKHEGALAYLRGEKRGLVDATLDHFALGLSAPYKRADGMVTARAIVAPMRSPETGSFLNKSAYICVPGVTENPVDTNGWMKGEAQCYYAEKVVGQRILFICEGLKDVWRHWQALSAAGLTNRIAIVTSTHGSAIPAIWKTPDFWERWDEVYLGHDNDEAGEKIAARVLELAGSARRIRVPKELGKDWTDFWQANGSIESFERLLDEAPVASEPKIEVEAPQAQGQPIQRIGRFSHRPVDINSAYVNGFMYYPTETHVVAKDEETGQLVERLETIVVRSDKTLCRARYAPAPAGTPLHQRVLKLNDGTVLEKEPKASQHRTWDYEAIQAWLEGKAKTRPLKDIVSEILGYLKQAIWLPYEEDYVVLALTVPVTFLQVVFESVPLILMNGPAGSGKSQTGSIMARLCANGVVIGQVSAASAARLIDETRGFVVLDDVESIAAKAGKDAQISEFVQALKVSYNRHTAIKYWTDIKTMKTEKLDFFGVKLLSNTLGADAILGTRMLRVQTRKMPDGMKSKVRDFDHEDLRRLRELRNELHCWAFENVKRVAEVYGEVYANKTDRHAEISAPLRVMAKIVGDPVLSAELEKALARQHIKAEVFNDDPVETLKDAVRNLIKQGFETVTLTHLRLEMRALLDANYGQDLTNAIPEWDRPEWIGRQLRSNDLAVNEDLGRKRFFGKNLRLVRFSEWVVEDVVGTHDEEGNPVYARPNKDPEAFCQGCKGCPYRAAGCELMELRQKEEASSRRGRSH